MFQSLFRAKNENRFNECVVSYSMHRIRHTISSNDPNCKNPASRKQNKNNKWIPLSTQNLSNKDSLLKSCVKEYFINNRSFWIFENIPPFSNPFSSSIHIYTMQFCEVHLVNKCGYTIIHTMFLIPARQRNNHATWRTRNFTLKNCLSSWRKAPSDLLQRLGRHGASTSCNAQWFYLIGAITGMFSAMKLVVVRTQKYLQSTSTFYSV